jgi:uncharacterized protein (TIGR02598 family)
MSPSFSSARHGGFSLVEVSLALGVAAFCLVPLFGLLPIGVNNNRASFEQTGAANVASAVVTDLRATTLTLPAATTDPTSPYYQVPIPGTPSGAGAFNTLFVRQNGTLSGTVDTDANAALNPHYRVTLFFTAAGTAASTSTAGNPNATSVRVLITWPALADPAHRSVPTQYSGAFETVVGLIRG